MNKKLFMMALCMVGHSGYAGKSMPRQPRNQHMHRRGLPEHRQQYATEEEQQQKMDRAVQYNKRWEDIQAHRETLQGQTKKLQEYTPTTNADGLQMVKDAERMVNRGKQLWAEFIDAEERVARDKKDGKEGDKTSFAENLARDRMGDDLYTIFKQKLNNLEKTIQRAKDLGDL